MTHPLWAPLITPFRRDQSVDFAALQHNMERYDQTSLDGYLVNGSSGEAEMLSLREREEILRFVCGATSKRILAGIVASSVHDAADQVQALEDLELEAVLVRTPSYYGRQLDQIAFFSELAERSPHPVMIYQIPQYTGIRVSGEELFTLSQHPNIVGIKDSFGDLAMINEKTWPADFRYYLGASALIQPGVAAGAKGGILALANVVPELCRELLLLSADPERGSEARRLQQRLIPLNSLLGGSKGYGLAGLKAACEIVGFEAGDPRRPLRAISKAQRETLAKAIAKLVQAGD